MTKGIAVVSGSSAVKHKLMDDGVAELGHADAISTLSGTVTVLGSAGDIVTRLETLSGSVRTRTTDSATTHSPLGTNLENVRVSTAASAVDGANNGHDYVARADTNYANSASSLLDADLKLDTQLDASKADINRINGSNTTSGSLAYQVSQRLEGTGVEETWKTLEALKTAMDADTDLRGTLTSKITAMKSEIRGTAQAPNDTIAAQQITLSAHNNTAENTHEAGLTTKLSNATSSIGASSAFAVDYGNAEATNYLNGKASLHAADDELDKKLQSRQNRLDAMLGAAAKTVDGSSKAAGMRSDSLTVAANKNAEMSGDTSCEKFFTPKVSTIADIEASPEEGEVFYLECSAAEFSANSTTEFPANNKFYFREDSQWFASPFFYDNLPTINTAGVSTTLTENTNYDFASNATATDIEDGALAVTADPANASTMAVGANQTVTFTATDSQNQTATATVDVTIEADIAFAASIVDNGGSIDITCSANCVAVATNAGYGDVWFGSPPPTGAPYPLAAGTTTLVKLAEIGLDQGPGHVYTFQFIDDSFNVVTVQFTDS